MKVLIVGSSGMVGQGVLLECLKSQAVQEIVLLVRRAMSIESDKVTQIILEDFAQMNFCNELLQLTEIDACFYCFGVTSAGMSELAYKTITYDLTLQLANLLQANNRQATFIYVSGAGADSSEQGRVMWANVRGKTENALQGVGFKAVYILRPSIIQPLNGIQSRTKSYRIIYRLFKPLFPLLKIFAPNSYVTTQQIGQAMLNLVNPEKAFPNILEVKQIIKAAQ